MSASLIAANFNFLALSLRADARKLRRQALQTGGHAARRLMARALGMDLEANDLLKKATFRLAYTGPEVPPLRSAAE